MTGILSEIPVGDEVEDVSVAHNIDASGDVIYSSHLHLGDDLALDIVNGKVNDIIMLCLKQDGTGGHIVTFSDKVQWAGGVAPNLTTTANGIDTFMFIHGQNGKVHPISYQLDVKTPA